MEIIITWLVMALAVALTSYLLPGIRVKNFLTALIVAALLGIVNAFVKPILVVLTLPVTVLTLGLFIFVINALLVMLVAGLVDDFKVKSFWWALAFSILLAIVSAVFDTIIS